ncbi:MAG TPA: enoyl-CoA hydratase/isomerase family protein [Candidatus Binatia bacterium]|jgi:enoyl-CoA hydratase|nr:enoyl-CoA hydratase/isomerase family protein [Candidatus Binatia bacterium]
MTPVQIEHDGSVAVVRIDDGKANAIGPTLLTALGAALDEIEQGPARSVVLAGRPGFFSGGLDLKLLPTLPPDEMRATSLAFVALVERVFLFPKPIVAASAGHALAGGFMLYCAADLRVALDDERSRYGLTEIEAGIPIIGPTAAVVIAAVSVPARIEVLLHGRRMTAVEAHAVGVVHETMTTADAVVPRAVERARPLERLGAAAYAISKRALREATIRQARDVGAALASQLSQGNPFAGLRR